MATEETTADTIGHTTADILAAQRAEVGTILVRTGKGGNDREYDVEPP